MSLVSSPPYPAHTRSAAVEAPRQDGLLAVALAGGAGLVVQASSAAAADQAEVRVPRSAEDHLQLAALYDRAAGAHREEAASLRASLADEVARLSLGPNKTGRDFPWVAKAKEAAEPKIAEADQAAADARRAAEYHRLRARELQGQEFAMLRKHADVAPR